MFTEDKEGAFLQRMRDRWGFDKLVESIDLLRLEQIINIQNNL